MDPKLRGTNAKYEEMWVETSGDSWETVMAKVGSEECPWNIGNLVDAYYMHCCLIVRINILLRQNPCIYSMKSSVL